MRVRGTNEQLPPPAPTVGDLLAEAVLGLTGVVDAPLLEAPTARARRCA